MSILSRWFILISLIAVKCPGHSEMMTWDDCKSFGTTATVAEVFNFVKNEPLFKDVPINLSAPSPCLAAVLRGFATNPLAGENEIRLALSKLKERSRLIHYGGLLSTLAKEHSRFRNLIQSRIAKDVSHLLEIEPNLEDREIGWFLSGLPSFLFSADDAMLRRPLEQLIERLPIDHVAVFYRHFANSPMAERMGLDQFILMFKNRSEPIYRFLEDMSWLESMNFHHDQLNKGWAPRLELYIEATQKVLHIGRTTWTVKAVENLERLVEMAGTQNGQIQNVPQILGSLKIRQALLEALESAPELSRDRINLLLVKIDEFVRHRPAFAESADQELKTCVDALLANARQD